MLELLLTAILVILLLIYILLRKNIKETDGYFAAIDLSLRQFFENTSKAQEENDRKRHDEILKQLCNISSHTSAAERILNEVHHPKSVEDEHYLAEKSSKWLP